MSYTNLNFGSYSNLANTITRSNYSGLGYFGKGGQNLPPPPGAVEDPAWVAYRRDLQQYNTCINNSGADTGDGRGCGAPPVPPGAGGWWGRRRWDQQGQPMMQQGQPMMQQGQPAQQASGQSQPTAAPSWSSESLTAPSAPLTGTYQTAAGVTRVIQTDAANIAAQGGAVTGSQMTVQQALTSPGQSSFTRSSDNPGDNRRPDHWADLGPAPVGYNEQTYLQKNPDVATAVKAGAMPSGLWHYLKYGKKENRAFSGWRRSSRRPGYLAGVFANWNVRD